MRVLLSIKPEFVEKIFNGEKKYEYRKLLFKNKEVDTIVVYSTMPEGKIVGEFKIDGVLQDKPDRIWSITKKESGISRVYFDKYFENHNNGYAIKIGKVTLYDVPIDPKLDNEMFKAPQSFCYIE